METSTALARVEHDVTSLPSTRNQRALIAADQLAVEHDQRQLLGQYIQANMVEGVDYGVIPGTKQKTLLKPGAEKLVDLFRCTVQLEEMTKIEQWDSSAPLFHYQFRAKVVSRDGGVVLAEGIGSCNSRESKYRWREGGRKCPSCGAAAIIKGKADYGGGWLCFGRKGGCGAKFSDGDQSIEGQPTGRVENPDVFDVVNTILKMAVKRALVAAAISLGRCSDLFTQDMEDDEPPAPPEPRPQPRQSKPAPAQAHPKDPETSVPVYSGTNEQKKELARLVKAQLPDADKARLQAIAAEMQGKPLTEATVKEAIAATAPKPAEPAPAAPNTPPPPSGGAAMAAVPF